MTRIRFDGCDLSPRTRAPRYAKGIAVAALAVALCACGGSGRLSKAQYEQRVNDAGRQLSAVFGTVAATPAEPAQQAARIRRARSALDHVVDDLSTLKPPPGAEPGNRALVAALRTVSLRLERLATADAAGDSAAVKRAQLEVAAGGRRVLAAIRELQRAGFAVNQG
jgi:hypothetical protein